MSGTIEITVDLVPVTVSMSAEDALVDLPKAEQDAANASTVIELLQEHTSRVSAMRNWELLDDQEFTINVRMKDAAGNVTEASW